MYCTRNFKTKKQLKEAVAAWNEAQTLSIVAPMTIGAVLAHKADRDPEPVTVFQPGPFGGNVPLNGTAAVEGPHYPKPHRWYASVTLKDGVVVKVR